MVLGTDFQGGQISPFVTEQCNCVVGLDPNVYNVLYNSDSSTQNKGHVNLTKAVKGTSNSRTGCIDGIVLYVAKFNLTMYLILKYHALSADRYGNSFFCSCLRV